MITQALGRLVEMTHSWQDLDYLDHRYATGTVNVHLDMAQSMR